MKSTRLLAIFLCGAVHSFIATSSHASLVFNPGAPTSQVNNLVLNGSFELGAPPDGTQLFWANSSASPYVIPPLWQANDNGNAATWGNDGASPYRLKASDVLPDGRIGIDFHTATGVTVDQKPNYNLVTGEVTFPAQPNFSNAPVILGQNLGVLPVAPSYNLSFWVSGEENATVQGFNGPGLIGLRVTNTVPGNPAQPVNWVAVPNAFYYGQSIQYEYTFTTLNPLLPVAIQFWSWGGLDLSAYANVSEPHLTPFHNQPILDDIRVNAVPEPSSILLLVAGLIGLLFMSIIRPRRLQRCPVPRHRR